MGLREEIEKLRDWVSSDLKRAICLAIIAKHSEEG